MNWYNKSKTDSPRSDFSITSKDDETLRIIPTILYSLAFIILFVGVGITH